MKKVRFLKKRLEGQLGKRYIGKNGFSLAELMLAVFILALVLTSFLAVMVFNSLQAVAADNMSGALASAQSKIDEVRDSTFESILSVYNGENFSPDQPNNANGVVAVTAVGAEDSGKLLKVDVTITWQNRDGRSNSTSLSSLVAKK